VCRRELNSEAAALFPAIPLQNLQQSSEMKRETDDYFPLAIFVTLLGNRPIEVAKT
jgi:hypothetical protein